MLLNLAQNSCRTLDLLGVSFNPQCACKYVGTLRRGFLDVDGGVTLWLMYD